MGVQAFQSCLRRRRSKGTVWQRAVTSTYDCGPAISALDVDPLTALAIPYVVSNGEDWNEMTTRTIVLDRIRLASLLDGLEPDAGLVEWTSLQMQVLSEGLA